MAAGNADNAIGFLAELIDALNTPQQSVKSQNQEPQRSTPNDGPAHAQCTFGSNIAGNFHGMSGPLS